MKMAGFVGLVEFVWWLVVLIYRRTSSFTSSNLIINIIIIIIRVSVTFFVRLCVCLSVCLFFFFCFPASIMSYFTSARSIGQFRHQFSLGLRLLLFPFFNSSIFLFLLAFSPVAPRDGADSGRRFDRRPFARFSLDYWWCLLSMMISFSSCWETEVMDATRWNWMLELTSFLSFFFQYLILYEFRPCRPNLEFLSQIQLTTNKFRNFRFHYWWCWPSLAIFRRQTDRYILLKRNAKVDLRERE